MRATLNKNWTRDFHGLSHLGKSGIREGLFRVSVQKYKGSTLLKLWTPHCGFNPDTKTFTGKGHNTEARLEGEKWLKDKKHTF